MADVAPGLLARILKVLDVENPSQAARKLGKAKQSVYDWDEKVPGLVTLIEIAESANTSLDYLVLDKGPPNLDPLQSLGASERKIVRKMASDSGKEVEEVLRELVGEGLIRRVTQMLANSKYLSAKEIDQLHAIVDLVGTGDPGEAKRETSRRRPSA